MRHCASIKRVLGSGAMGDGEEISCFGYACAVACDCCVALTKKTARIAGEEAGETESEESLKEGIHGLLHESYLGLAGNMRRVMMA